jgi:hypothetical protein
MEETRIITEKTLICHSCHPFSLEMTVKTGLTMLGNNVI